MKHCRVIGLDADDTLWHNETIFERVHERYRELLSSYHDAAYGRVLRRHGVALEEFAMVGNSLKSDILPVLALGGAGVHIPYHITWQHEHVAEPPHRHARFRRADRLAELPLLLAAL